MGYVLDTRWEAMTWGSNAQAKKAAQYRVDYLHSQGYGARISPLRRVMKPDIGYCYFVYKSKTKKRRK